MLRSALALVVALITSSIALCADAQTSSQGGSAPLSPMPAGETRDAQARFGALRATPSGDVAVVEESVSMRCTTPDDALFECELEASWTLRSARAADVQLMASAVGVVDATLACGDASSDAPSLVPLTCPLGADSPAVVRLRGHVRLRPEGGNMDAIDGRHLVLATPRAGPHATVLFTRAVARTFGRTAPTLRVTLDRDEAGASMHARVLDLDADGGQVTLDSSSLGERASIPIRLEREGGFPLRHGGPFLALGGTFDRGFRARIGYEIGIDELVLVSVALDSDFYESIVVGAMIEVATPSFIVPPSLSAGLGFVQRVRVDSVPPGLAATSSGFRLEVGAVLAVLGIVASFDYFPDDAAFTSSLLGRLSL